MKVVEIVGYNQAWDRWEVHANLGLKNAKEWYHLGFLSIDWSIILNWILKDFSMWIRFIWLILYSSDGILQCNNGPSDSIKGREFLDKLSDC
jgi:hypothetical protein